MDYERNDTPQNEDWIDDVLGAPVVQDEIGPDEHAVQSAGLIHPDDMELEMILAEHREDAIPEESAYGELDNNYDVPVDGEEEYSYEDPALDESQFSLADNEPQEQIYSDPDETELLYEEEEPIDEEIEEPQEKTRPRRKKGYGLLGIPHLLATGVWLALILVIGISLGRVLWLCCADLMAFGKEPNQVTITINDDDTIDSISQMLAEKGLVRYPGLFKTFAELTGKAENISQGTFTLNSRLDYNAMINGMTQYASDREEVTVMFPEGYTCAQIFRLLEKENVCTVAELEEYAANGELDEYWFLEGVERGDKYCLEGYLFPDTYNFYTNDDPERVLEKFLDAFDDRFTDIMRERLVLINETFAKRLAAEGYDQAYIDSHPITIREAVIIASMIEKESSGGEESYNVSSVIYNRLVDTSQPPYLNIDASVIYGLGGKIDPETGESIPLTQADLETDTPYNTYLHTGLTPGPIANPGQESLNAAVMPNETNYYYYALNPATGEHKFSTTYKEHLKFLDSLG